jgi:hypothetical protein
VVEQECGHVEWSRGGGNHLADAGDRDPRLAVQSVRKRRLHPEFRVGHERRGLADDRVSGQVDAVDGVQPLLVPGDGLDWGVETRPDEPGDRGVVGLGSWRETGQEPLRRPRRRCARG